MSVWVGILNQVPKDPNDAKQITVEMRKVSLALAKIGPPAINVLVQALGHRDAVVRQRAVSALTIMGRPAIGALAELVRTLKDPDPRIRQGAAIALARIGSARPSSAGLILALKDSEPPVRATAATALGMIGAMDAVPALKETTADANVAVRQAAQQALMRLEGKQVPSPGAPPPKPPKP